MVKQHAKCLSVCTAVNFWDCDVPLYRCGTYGYAVTYSTINQQVVGEKMKFCEFKCNPQGWGDQSYFTFDDFEFLSRRDCKKFWDCDMPLYTLCRRDLWQPESRINQQVVGEKMKKRCAQASMVKQHAKCLSVCTAMKFWDCDVPLYRCGSWGKLETYSKINQQVVGEKMKFCEFECNP